MAHPLFHTGFHDRTEEYPVIIVADGLREARWNRRDPAAYVRHLGETPGLRPVGEPGKRGRSEPVLEAALRACFGPLVHTDVTLDFGNAPRPYLPDFVYHDPRTGTALDIEVDEPYAFSTGAPIHRNDHARDRLFARAGWTVVRFAEAQVLDRPYGCCRVVEQVAAMIECRDEWGVAHLPVPRTMPRLEPSDAVGDRHDDVWLPIEDRLNHLRDETGREEAVTMRVGR